MLFTSVELCSLAGQTGAVVPDRHHLHAVRDATGEVLHGAVGGGALAGGRLSAVAQGEGAVPHSTLGSGPGDHRIAAPTLHLHRHVQRHTGDCREGAENVEGKDRELYSHSVGLSTLVHSRLAFVDKVQGYKEVYLSHA